MIEMKEYSISDIEQMVDDLPNSPLKRLAKQAMKAVDKAGISKNTKIIDADEHHAPTGRNTPFDTTEPIAERIPPDLDEQIEYDVKSSSPKKVFRLSDAEVKELLKKDTQNGR